MEPGVLQDMWQHIVIAEGVGARYGRNIQHYLLILIYMYRARFIKWRKNEGGSKILHWGRGTLRFRALLCCVNELDSIFLTFNRSCSKLISLKWFFFSKRDIPCKNYQMHTAHCMRNITLCTLCDEPIMKKDFPDHKAQCQGPQAVQEKAKSPTPPKPALPPKQKLHTTSIQQASSLKTQVVNVS